MRQRVSVVLFAFFVLGGCSQSQQMPAPGKSEPASFAKPKPGASAQSVPAPGASTALAAAQMLSGELLFNAMMLQGTVQIANNNIRLHELDAKAYPNVGEGDLSKNEHEIRAKAAAAYDEWRRQASPAQLEAGKKLYAAWLTYADGLVACYGTCDPEGVDSGPYGLAWHQAQNEFKIDTQ